MTIDRSKTYTIKAFGQQYRLEYCPKVDHWGLYITQNGAAIFMAREFQEVKNFADEEIQYQSSLRKNQYGTKTNKWTARASPILETSVRLPRFKVRG